MTDLAGPPTGDIQRPLDESAPIEVDQTMPLRPAAPGPPETVPTTSVRGFVGRAATPVAWAHAGRRLAVGLRRAPVRSARALAAWSRRPAGRVALPAVTVLALVAAAVAAGAFGVPSGHPASSSEPPDAAPGPAVSPGSTPAAEPPGSPDPTAPAGTAGLPADVLRGWAQQMSERTDIPVVALQAYGYAELVLAETTPGCRLSWTTLAAIGRVESDHGHTGGAALGSDGRAEPEIIGPPLDGQGDRRLIEDTDGGRIDGDDVYDRAVGPMQFIPQTWLAEQVDATGDGVADPHNVHDAALAAANYLCRGGRDLATAQGWWEAVLAYNDVQQYADEVFAAANEYGQLSRG